MADYGLKIWDAGGNLTLDTTDKLTRLMYSTTLGSVGAGNSGNQAQLDGLSTIQFGISDNAPNPKVWRTSNTIYWDFGEDTLILCFAYD